MNPVLRHLVRGWLNTQANVALLFGLKRRALALHRKMVQLNPRDAIARSTAGNLRAQLGDTEGAIAEFRQLLEIDPRSADAWFNLGFLLEGRDALDEAERAFRRAVELNPSLDRAWYGLGLVLIRTDQLRAAVDALKRNTKLQPFSPYGWYQLGMTYHHLGESTDAWRTYEHLKSFEPRFAATLKRDLETTPSRTPSESSTSMHITPREAIETTN